MLKMMFADPMEAIARMTRVDIMVTADVVDLSSQGISLRECADEGRW